MSQNAVERTVGSSDEDLDLLEALRDREPAAADRLVSAHRERAYQRLKAGYLGRRARRARRGQSHLHPAATR